MIRPGLTPTPSRSNPQLPGTMMDPQLLEGRIRRTDETPIPICDFCLPSPPHKSTIGVDFDWIRIRTRHGALLPSVVVILTPREKVSYSLAYVTGLHTSFSLLVLSCFLVFVSGLYS